MKRVAITGLRQAGTIDVPDPRPHDDLVLVRVDVSPLCTQAKFYADGTPLAEPGHEAAGVVVEAPRTSLFRSGDRVVVMPLYACGTCGICLSGEAIYCPNQAVPEATPDASSGEASMAQYLLKPPWLLAPIPDDISIEAASLSLCALGPSFGAFQRAKLGAHDTVFIAGAGPVGLGAVNNAVFRGARTIVAESVPFRRDLARDLGAEIVVDPQDPDCSKQIRAATAGAGVRVALDCSGSPAGQRLCLDVVGILGQVAFVGLSERDLTVRGDKDFLYKGVTVFGSWHYNLGDFPLLMDLLRRKPDLRRMVTHRFSMDDIAEAFDVALSRECGKILLFPWGLADGGRG